MEMSTLANPPRPFRTYGSVHWYNPLYFHALDGSYISFIVGDIKNQIYNWDGMFEYLLSYRFTDDLFSFTFIHTQWFD